eukprot:scaffold71996_cov51-Phaeocystis_antarctica.AAC.1
MLLLDYAAPSLSPPPSAPQSCTVSTYWDSTTLPDGYGPGSFNFMVTGHTEDTNVDCVISSSADSTCCAGGGGWTFPAGRTEAKGGTPTSEPAAGDTVTCTAQGGGCTGQSDTCRYKGGGSAECISGLPLPPSLPPPPPPSPPSQPPSIISSAITCSGGSYPQEVGWSLSCSDDTTLSGGAPYTSSVPLAVALGAMCTLDMTDSYGDGWNGNEWAAPGFGQSFSLADGGQGTKSFVVQFQPSPPSPPPPSPPSPPPPLPSPPPPSPSPPPPSPSFVSCCEASFRYSAGYMCTNPAAPCQGTLAASYNSTHAQCRHLADPWSNPACVIACATCSETAHCVPAPSPPPPLPPSPPSPPPPPPPPPPLPPPSPWAADLAALGKRIEERHAAQLEALVAARVEDVTLQLKEARQELQAVRHELYEQLQDVREC